MDSGEDKKKLLTKISKNVFWGEFPGGAEDGSRPGDRHMKYLRDAHRKQVHTTQRTLQQYCVLCHCTLQSLYCALLLHYSPYTR